MVGRSSESRASFEALWEERASAVRRQLSRFGVGEADLDDLAQEVFLVAHAKRELLPRVQHVDLWFREVCRRVAAAHRRRARRRHEIAVGQPPEQVHQGTVIHAHLEQDEEEERLHRALDRLDDESRDLVALHQLGNMPLVDVATLVHADRKTVRKRLGLALRRLTHLLKDRGRASSPPPASTRPSTPPSDRSSDGEPFQVLARHPDVNIGLVGAIVVAVWPGAPTMSALEVLDEQLERGALICNSNIVYFAVIESTTAPPSLEARKIITKMIRDHAVHVDIHVTSMEGGGAWIAQPILTALAHLARPPFPIHFFSDTPSATRFLAEQYPFDSKAQVQHILSAVEQLRNVARAAS